MAHAPILVEEDKIKHVGTGSHDTGFAGTGQLYARPVAIVALRRNLPCDAAVMQCAIGPKSHDLSSLARSLRNESGN